VFPKQLIADLVQSGHKRFMLVNIREQIEITGSKRKSSIGTNSASMKGH
jgi:hypothetical protein